IGASSHSRPQGRRERAERVRRKGTGGSSSSRRSIARGGGGVTGSRGEAAVKLFRIEGIGLLLGEGAKQDVGGRIDRSRSRFECHLRGRSRLVRGRNLLQAIVAAGRFSGACSRNRLRSPCDPRRQHLELRLARGTNENGLTVAPMS